MRILITGAAGMLGHDLRQGCEATGHEAIALSRAQLDVADPGKVHAAIAEAGVEVVVNCAAWTDVDGAESDPAGALAVNAAGAGHVAAAAQAEGVWVLHVSTDYVFSGDKDGAYLESDLTGPLSAYGRSKLEGERAVAAAAPERHTIVRSAWLFGAHGRCFPRTMLRLAAERSELNVVNDQVGCPTFTGHLAQALVSLAEDPMPGVVHVAGAGSCSWHQLAVATIAAGGLDCAVRPIATDQYPLPARRPANSVLRSERGAPELPDWTAGLAAFMSELAQVAA